MEQNIISVIVPCYNVENYVDRCLKSIINQTYGREQLQIILVNDASIDRTLNYLERWEKLYPEQIVLVNCKENHMPGAARNIGMQYVVGEYVTFVDADDVIDVTMIEKMHQRLCQYGCDIVACRHKEFKEGDVLAVDVIHEDIYIKFDTIKKRKEFILNSFKTAVWGRMYKTEFLRENALAFPENIYYEDCYFSGLVMLLVGSYCTIGETLYYYCRNPEGIMHSAANVDKVKWGIDVEKELIQEIIARKILPESLEPYRQEIEFHVTVKGCLDAIGILADVGQMKHGVLAYLIRNLLELFPNCIDNYYLNKFQISFWRDVREIIENDRIDI